MSEVREVLRAWLTSLGLRRVAAQTGVDRKVARRYVEAAGLVRDAGEAQLTDELIGQVVERVRPAGHGAAWETLEPWASQITGWLERA